jgi:hypothetical protein
VLQDEGGVDAGLVCDCANGRRLEAVLSELFAGGSEDALRRGGSLRRTGAGLTHTLTLLALSECVIVSLNNE